MIVSGAPLLAACTSEPEPPQIPPRPTWEGAEIEGIRPLMSPAEVRAALDRGGFKQVPCLSDEPLEPDPLTGGTQNACYRAPGKATEASLFFLNLREGRRLAVATFREPYDPDLTREQRRARTQAYADTLEKRFGKPFIVTRSGDQFDIIYWRRPGGSESLPDMLSTTVSEYEGPNVTLTSMWAYGEQRGSGTHPGAADLPAIDAPAPVTEKR